MWRTIPLAFFVLAFSPPAHSSPHTLQVSTDLGYACFAEAQRHHGAFGGASVNWTFSDVFGILGHYNLSEHRSKGDSQGVHRVAFGAIANLDVFEYIPWASLSAATLFARGDHFESATNLGFGFGLGVDRLLDPNWSVGFTSQFDQLFGQERFPAYMLLGLRVGYRWRLGDPFAP